MSVEALKSAEVRDTSGIQPTGNHVVVKPRAKEKVTGGGIIIPEQISERHSMGQTFGEFVAGGPDAWNDFSRAWAEPGDRVLFARYGGIQVTGEDGKTYRILNDIDITAVVSEQVLLSEEGYV